MQVERPKATLGWREDRDPERRGAEGDHIRLYTILAEAVKAMSQEQLTAARCVLCQRVKKMEDLVSVSYEAQHSAWTATLGRLCPKCVLLLVCDVLLDDDYLQVVFRAP